MFASLHTTEDGVVSVGKLEGGSHRVTPREYNSHPSENKKGSNLKRGRDDIIQLVQLITRSSFVNEMFFIF